MLLITSTEYKVLLREFGWLSKAFVYQSPECVTAYFNGEPVVVCDNPKCDICRSRFYCYTEKWIGKEEIMGV